MFRREKKIVPPEPRAFVEGQNNQGIFMTENGIEMPFHIGDRVLVTLKPKQQFLNESYPSLAAERFEVTILSFPYSETGALTHVAFIFGGRPLSLPARDIAAIDPVFEAVPRADAA